jgi:hypothetical protein
LRQQVRAWAAVHARARLLQLGKQLLALGDALGRHVQEAQPALRRVGRLGLDAARLGAVGQVGGQQLGSHAQRTEPVDLVLHQAH